MKKKSDEDTPRIIYSTLDTVTYYKPSDDFRICYSWQEPTEELTNKEIHVDLDKKKPTQ